MSAARAADGTVRLGVTGVGPHGLLISADDTDGLPYADDALASAWYRKRTLPVLVRRALTKLGDPA